MRTVQQTDLHCELTGLNVLRGLSGKPEPVCPNAESDSELLSASLKSPTISSMTGISEKQYTSRYNTAIWHALLTSTCQYVKRGGAHLHTHKHTDETYANREFSVLELSNMLSAFDSAKSQLPKHPHLIQLLICSSGMNKAHFQKG